MSIDDLRHDGSFGVDQTGLYKNGRPQWFKVWAEKYAVALDIENIDEEFADDPDGKLEFFEEVGKCFINALLFFKDHDNEEYQYYRPKTRDGRILWNALKHDVDQTFIDYDKRVQDGKKGGRPRTASQDQD